MTQPKPILQSDWIGYTIANRYKLEAVLGQGGMSTVYKATDPNLRRPVAVKLIHSHLSVDPQFVRRFEQEAAAVAQLRHPNIIQVYDFDHEGDLYYMVLEFVPGETLQTRLKSLNAVNRRLSPAEATGIMMTICDAVSYAHEHGMIHRDLKPANVMLNPQGEPILMDFGVAKMLGEAQHTATGAVVGTAKYMSPEQARGVRPDERVDIYSLGVMLYEMVAGQPPFDGESAVSIMMKHVNDPLPDISQIQSNVPDELIEVIQKSLAKSPDERYQTAAEMGTALREASRSLSEITIPSSRKESLDAEPSDLGSASAMSENTSASSATLPALSSQRKQIFIWLAAAGAAILLVGVGLVALFVMFFSQLWSSPEDQILAAEQTAAEGPTSTEGPTSAVAEQALASAEQAHLPSSERMVKIGAGAYTVGLDGSNNDYAPLQQIELAEFWLDQYEVTNAQYEAFLNETGAEPPSSWNEGTFLAGQENYPVEGITWDMAVAYCEWAKKRLPTEAEWEVAARGSEGLLYPWGNEERAVEFPRTGTYAVGSIVENRSPFGIFDMVGNVWEWVGEPYAPVEPGNRILRGGAHGFLQDTAYRLQGDPGVPTMSATAGIRCAADEVRIVDTHTVLFEDNFTDPNSGWPVLAEESGLFGYHPPAYYHVEVSVPEEYGIVSRGPNFDNAVVESDVFVAKTDTDNRDFRYGLAMRRSGEQFYAFTISPRSKTWYVLKSSPDGLEVLDQGTFNAIQGLSEDTADILNVYASGNNFVFHINGQIVTEVSDRDYTNGEIGFYVENFDESMSHIHYKSLTVREIEAGEVAVIRGEQALSQDDFTDPDSGWPVLVEESGLYGYHPPAFYHVEVSTPSEKGMVSRGPNFDNVTIESDMFVAKTDTDTGDFRYGLVIRRSGEQFYAFTISPRSKTWYVLKSSSSGLDVLDEGSNDTIQGFGEDNADVLRVDAKGTNFAFHINDQIVTLAGDVDYANGEVGFYVENFDESMAHIHYDMLTIREVEFEEAAEFVPEATLEPDSSTSDVVGYPAPTR